MFLVNCGALEGRIDPIFYSGELFGFLKTTPYSIKKIRGLVYDLKSGFGAGKQDQAENKNGIIQIRPTNVGNEGNLKFDRNIYLPLELLETQKENLLQQGDVLFNNTNSQDLVGKTAYFAEEGNFLFSNHITRIRVKENEILPQFLVLLLNSFHKRKIFYSICTNWNNQSGVGIDLLGSLKIPIPPLETQAQIVSIFEQAYERKKAQEAEAKRLLESIEGYLLEKLGIAIKNPQGLEDLADLEKRHFFVNFSQIQGKRFDPFYHKTEFKELELALENGKYELVKFKSIITDLKNGVEIRDYAANGFRYLRVTDLDKHDINDANMRFVSVNEVPEKIKLNKNCILVSRSGSLGLVSVVTDDLLNSILSSHIFKIELDTKVVIPEYLETYFRATLGQKQFFKNNNGGVIPEINQTALKSILIPLPPLEIQTEIAEHISGIRAEAKRLENEAQAGLEKAKKEVEKLILG